MSTVFRVSVLITMLWVWFLGLARAEPVLVRAPDPVVEGAPWLGPGWTVQEGLYARVHGHDEDRAAVARVAARVEARLPELARELELREEALAEVDALTKS